MNDPALSAAFGITSAPAEFRVQLFVRFDSRPPPPARGNRTPTCAGNNAAASTSVEIRIRITVCGAEARLSRPFGAAPLSVPGDGIGAVTEPSPYVNCGSLHK